MDKMKMLFEALWSNLFTRAIMCVAGAMLLLFFVLVFVVASASFMYQLTLTFGFGEGMALTMSIVTFLAEVIGGGIGIAIFLDSE